MGRKSLCDEMKIKKTVLMFGYGCNNKCIFCYNDDKRNVFDERSTEELEKEITFARKRGSQYLEIIGGEPTTRRDIYDLIKFSKELGFETVMFATNGRMFQYKEFTRKLLSSSVDELIFSIHGHTAKLHDSLTCVPESFNQLIDGISNVKSMGFDKIGSNTTIVQQNYKHLPDIGQMIFDLGIRNSEFIFVDPNHGAPKRDFYEIVPKISDIEKYVHECLEIGKDKTSHWDIRYFPLCYAENYLGQVSELKEVETFHTEHIAPDFVNKNVEESRKSIGRQKTEKCGSCKLYDKCEGIWIEYLRNYGDKELRPVSD
jgi:MoaA/NifB/PqqE/SkfB family radical SAM enzyme